MSIERFQFDVTPVAYDDPRHNQWQVTVTVNGIKHNYVTVVPNVPFNQTEFEVYLRAVFAEFREAHRRWGEA